MLSAFLTSFMSSKLTVRWTNFLVFSSTPGEPLIGVFVSFKKTMVATNTNISTKVFQINLNPDQTAINNHQNPPELVEPALFLTGTLGTASGSEVFRVQARRRETRDAPSPIEWWILKTPTASACEVFMLRRWSSHNGLERSIKQLN